MNTLLIVFQIGLLIWLIITLIRYFARQHQVHGTWRKFLEHAKPIRQLTSAEREAVARTFKHTKVASDDVYLLEGPGHVEGLRSNRGNDLHLVVAGVRLKPFPQWALFKHGGELKVEVVRARHSAIAVPVSINGLSLAEAAARKTAGAGIDYAVVERPGGGTEVVSEDDAGEDLTGDARALGQHQETARDAVLRKTTASNNAGMLFVLGMGLAIALVTSWLPGIWQWLGVVGAVLIAYSGWKLLREWKAPLAGRATTIRTLEGRLGIRKVAGKNERDPSVRTQALVGNTPVTYPTGWGRMVTADMLRHPERRHRVSIDADNVVVTYDDLSIYEQHARYPVPRWGRYLMMAVVGVPLAFAAWWWGGPAVSSLQTARARLAHSSRHLTAGTPTQLLAAKPVVGDWLTIKGSAKCSGGSDTADVALMQHLLRGNAITCTSLGWTKGNPSDRPIAGIAVALKKARWQVPTPMAELAALEARLSSLDAGDYSHRSIYARVHDLERFQRQVDLNRLVPAVQAACGTVTQACRRLEIRVRRLVDGPSAWNDLVQRAQAGQLPSEVTVEKYDASSFAAAIAHVLGEAVHRQQLTLLTQWRKAVPAKVYLTGLDGGLPTSASDALNYVAGRLRGASGRNVVLLPVIRMQHAPFSITGEVRDVVERNGTLRLAIAVGNAPQTLFSLIAAPLIFLLALLLIVIGVPGVVKCWPTRRKMKAAEAQYLAKHA